MIRSAAGTQEEYRQNQVDVLQMGVVFSKNVTYSKNEIGHCLIADADEIIYACG